MDNQFDSATPEQKLNVLIAELRTPVEVIRGLAEVITLHASNRIEPDGILSATNTISEAANRIKNLLDEVIQSKGFYTPSDDLTSTDIILSLRQSLLDAREQNDKNALGHLAMVFDLISGIAAKKNIEGRIFRILEDLEASAYDSIQAIPSEEEIISALNRN